MSEKLRVLIVDDDRRMAGTLKDILNIKGYEAEAAYSGPEALVKVIKSEFDCVLSDIRMPQVNGVELYRAIKARQPDLPVVLMTAYTTNKLVKEGLEQGALAVLTKPLDISAFFHFLSALRKERSIIIVDDDPEFCRTLGDILRARGFTVTQVTDPSGVMERLEPDIEVVLLDLKLDGINSLDILKEIRRRHPRLPVILVTGYQKEMAPAIETAMEIKAYACLFKPVQLEELFKLLTKIHHQELRRVLS